MTVDLDRAAMLLHVVESSANHGTSFAHIRDEALTELKKMEVELDDKHKQVRKETEETRLAELAKRNQKPVVEEPSDDDNDFAPQRKPLTDDTHMEDQSENPATLKRP